MKATGTIEVKSWDENTWDGRSYTEVEGRKLTEAHVQFTYAGDISGIGNCRYLMYYGDDVAWTTALEEITCDQGSLVLSPEQEAELTRFQQERVRIRKELRDVQRGLNVEIEQLGNRLQWINILAVPLLLAIGAIALDVMRRRRLKAGRAAAHTA